MGVSMPFVAGAARRHTSAMRVSRFWVLAEESSVLPTRIGRRLHAHGPLGGGTAQEALDAELPPRDVWVALCDAMDVPEDRRHGLDKPPRN